jgi:hypothetical protein
MDSKTRETILDLIRDIRYNEDLEKAGIETGSIENMLYGLFDGFDYSERIAKDAEPIKEVVPSLYFQLLGICKVVSEYPTGKTQIF